MVLANILHAELKQKTDHFHQKIESLDIFKKIVNQTILLDEYVVLIQKLYGFIYPCERRIQSLDCADLILGRQKTALLEKDRMALGFTKKTPLCENIPPMKSRFDVLGYLYVMEGATLGGQIMKKILERRFPMLIQNGIHYFAGYGEKTKPMWDQFCEKINSIKNEEEKEMVIKSACTTYKNLHDWIEQNENE